MELAIYYFGKDLLTRLCLYYLSSTEEELLKKSKYNTRVLKAGLDSLYILFIPLDNISLPLQGQAAKFRHQNQNQSFDFQKHSLFQVLRQSSKGVTRYLASASLSTKGACSVPGNTGEFWGAFQFLASLNQFVHHLVNYYRSKNKSKFVEGLSYVAPLRKKLL